MKESVHIFPSLEKLTDFFVGMISENISRISRDSFFYLALSGGSTPRAIFNSISENYKDKIDWSKVKIFWGDERCVAPDSDESNYKMAYESLFKKINFPESDIYRIKAETNPEFEIKRYAELIDQLLPHKMNAPQFDLVMLGLGEDGHIASIFPGNIHLFNSGNLFEISYHPATNQKRITATGRLINNARQVCFLVTGENKALIAAQVIKKKDGWQDLPASLVKPENSELVWLLDDKAGQMLGQPDLPGQPVTT